MKENLYVLLCWFVLIDSSLLLGYWLSFPLRRAASWLRDRYLWLKWFSL